MDGIDPADFGKARGFLIGYSLVVLLLWWFGADLTSFKLLGNEINLHKNINSVWFVIAMLNAYLWFRCYQRIPSDGLLFDVAMNRLFDKVLIEVVNKIYHKRMVGFVNREVKESPKEIGDANAIKVVKIKKNGYMAYDDGRAPADGYIRWMHDLSFLERTKIYYRFTVRYLQDGREVIRTGGASLEITPWVFLSYLALIYSTIKGVFVLPWATDYVTPLLFGLFSTSVAIYMWVVINLA